MDEPGAVRNEAHDLSHPRGSLGLAPVRVQPDHDLRQLCGGEVAGVFCPRRGAALVDAPGQGRQGAHHGIHARPACPGQQCGESGCGAPFAKADLIPLGQQERDDLFIHRDALAGQAFSLAMDAGDESEQERHPGHALQLWPLHGAVQIRGLGAPFLPAAFSAAAVGIPALDELPDLVGIEHLEIMGRPGQRIEAPLLRGIPGGPVVRHTAGNRGPASGMAAQPVCQQIPEDAPVPRRGDLIQPVRQEQHPAGPGFLRDGCRRIRQDFPQQGLPRGGALRRQPGRELADLHIHRQVQPQRLRPVRQGLPVAQGHAHGQVAEEGGLSPAGDAEQDARGIPGHCLEGGEGHKPVRAEADRFLRGIRALFPAFLHHGLHFCARLQGDIDIPHGRRRGGLVGML